MKRFWLVLALCFLASNVNAALFTYTDRTTFETQFSGLVNEDFEDVTSIAEVLAGTNIEPGLSLALTSGTDAYLAPPGQSSNPTQAVGVNTPTSAGWNMSFGTAVNVAGVDIFQNNGGGSQFGFDIFATVDVYGPSGLLGTFLATVPSGSAGFFGVYSDSEQITSVIVNEPSSYDVIDNVSFGQVQVDVAAVPALTPSGLLLLIMLLTGVGAVGFRRIKYR